MEETSTQLERNWLAWEVELLLKAVENRKTLRVYIQGQPEAVNSTLLGFDLNKGELLFDTFQGYSFYELIVSTEHKIPLTIALPCEADTFFIECRLNEVDHSSNGYLVSMYIQGLVKKPGRRFHKRLYFDQDKRPSAHISPAWSPRLQAELLDLSPYGCQLLASGKDLREQFDSKPSQLDIVFNQDFVLSCRSEVKQIQFFRKPCCHNRFRLIFKQLSAVQLEQLSAFVDSASLYIAA